MASDVAIRLALLFAGVAVLELGLIWRVRTQTHKIVDLAAELVAPRPDLRAVAAENLIRLGLDRAASPLLGFVQHEPDPDVRAYIALAVGRRQWEPAAAPGVADLRAWAAATLEEQGIPVQGFGPALTRLADMGGPRRPDYVPPQPASKQVRS